MKKIILYVLGILIVDLALFPVELTALPGMNLKMLLAAVGVICFGYNSVKNRSMEISRTLFGLMIISGLMSLTAYASTTINNTTDYVLAIYIISMLVWFFSAYAACLAIKRIHGRIDIPTIGMYLVAVCVMQCILALVIDTVPAFAQFVDRYFFSEYIKTAELRMMHRIYGIGAALDIAGIRFAGSLIILSEIILEFQRDDKKKKYIIWLWILFSFIFVIGNMVSRTTIIGGAIGLANYFFRSVGKNMTVRKEAFLLPVILVMAVIVFAYFGRNNSMFYQHLRFGFEGFFNLVENGEWSTHSTDILQTMYRWPSELKTWIIGDGLMEVDGHFYMFTDVGYIRFIYYFGTIGLSFFIMLYVFALMEGVKMSREHAIMFGLLFCLNMIVWFKVATDTFIIFAFLLNTCELSKNNDEEPEEDAV